jgi:hypothetical protein
MAIAFSCVHVGTLAAQQARDATAASTANEAAASPANASPAPPASETPASPANETAGSPASEPAGSPANEPAAQPGASPGRPTPGVIDRLDLGTTSITGNQELPKVLYIVPWKRSDLGDLAGRPLNTLLDEVLAPIDPEVFERQLSYYETLRGEQEEE